MTNIQDKKCECTCLPCDLYNHCGVEKCSKNDQPSTKSWSEEFDVLLEDYFISKESGIDEIKSFIQNLLEKERESYKKWLLGRIKKL